MSRTRCTDKVPHIAAETHLLQKKTQGLVRFLTFKHRVDEAIPGAGDVVVVLCGDVMMW
jgi:hypothetical protein